MGEGPATVPARHSKARRYAAAAGATVLGAGLAIGIKQVKTETGHEGGFTILTRNFDIGGAEPAAAIGHTAPAEDDPENELLPGFEPQGLALALALGVTEELKEINNELRGGGIEDKAALPSFSQVPKMAARRQLHLARAD